MGGVPVIFRQKCHFTILPNFFFFFFFFSLKLMYFFSKYCAEPRFYICTLVPEIQAIELFLKVNLH